MTLVDSSVWIDHLRPVDGFLVNLLNTGRMLAHPFVIGELALGRLQQRKVILDMLSNLSCANIAAVAEVLAFIDQSKLYGVDIGY